MRPMLALRDATAVLCCQDNLATVSKTVAGTTSACQQSAEILSSDSATAAETMVTLASEAGAVTEKNFEESASQVTLINAMDNDKLVVASNSVSVWIDSCNCAIIHRSVSCDHSPRVIPPSRQASVTVACMWRAVNANIDFILCNRIC